MHSVLLISGGWTQALQLIAALSVLIILHEFGHFFFAKLFKTRVEKFYLFFDFLFPFSGLLNFSLFKKKKGDTEYGIGWFPLGGYVKIAGMVDESMDKEELSKPPQPWEYRSKPAWQRLFIMLGGIIMNILVAMIIYMFAFGFWGEDYLPVSNLKYGIAADSLAERTIGLRDGDMIVSVDHKVLRYEEVMKYIIFDNAQTIEITRDGKAMSLPIPAGTVHSIIKGEKAGFITPRIPVVVHDVDKGSNADKMKLSPNDSIVAINDQPVSYLNDFTDRLNTLKGQTVRLTVVHKGQYAFLTGLVDTNGALGFHAYAPKRYLNVIHVKYNPFQAVGKGFTHAFQQFGDYWKQLKMIFTSKEVKVNESVGGIVSFGKFFSPEFDWSEFLQRVAFISIILAFMNLLPIPGLDGGYVIFLIWELVSGRKVSDKIMERATTVGLVLLLALMLYANGLDIFRLFKKH